MRQPLRSQLDVIVRNHSLSKSLIDLVFSKLLFVDAFLEREYGIKAELYDAILGEDKKSIDLCWEGNWRGKSYAIMLNFSEDEIGIYGCRPEGNESEDEICRTFKVNS